MDRYCELADKTFEQLYQVSTPCLDDHQSKKGRIGHGGRIGKCLLSDCLEVLVFGQKWSDLTFLWSVNEFARAVRKWIRACDKRSPRLISYIHNTSDHIQHCRVANTAQQCTLGLLDFGWNCVCFPESNVCSHKLDVQETNFSLTLFN